MSQVSSSVKGSYPTIGGKNAQKGKISKRAMKTFNYNEMSLQNTPRLVLKSLNNTFQTKTLELFDPIQIGRRVNTNKSTSGNGIFDSPILSKNHATIFYENGKVFIKDTKSSNGTFLNGKRLSEEAEESDNFEIKNNDEIEFGVDIEENGSIKHHKISCKIEILNDNDLENPTFIDKPQREKSKSSNKSSNSNENIKLDSDIKSIESNSEIAKNLKALENELSALEDQQIKLIENKNNNTQIQEQQTGKDDELRNILKSKDEELNKQNLEIKDLKKENNELKNKLSKTEKEITALKDQFSQDRRAQELAAHTVKENKDKIQNLLLKITELEKDNESKTKQIDGFNTNKSNSNLLNSDSASIDSLANENTGKNSVRRRKNKNNKLAKSFSQDLLDNKDDVKNDKIIQNSKWTAIKVFTVVAIGIISIGGLAYVSVNPQQINGLIENTRQKIFGK